MPPHARITSAAAAAMVSMAGALLLVACGGGADVRSEPSATVDASGRAVVQSAARETAAAQRLFIPDPGRATLLVSSTLTPAAGSTLAASALATGGAIGNNVQVDTARDELYTLAGRTVNVYAGAATLPADAVPVRSFALPPSLRTPRTLYLDAADDVLYVGGDTLAGLGEILAWNFAHTVRGTPATPARALFVDDGVAFFTIDPLRRRLYVANATSGVQVFANVDTASGMLHPLATIPVLGTGLAVDPARDRLYVADMFAGLILVDQASTAAPVVTSTLSIDDARFVAYDASHDRLYVSALGELYTLDNAGALTPATPLPAPAVARGATASFGTVGLR
jgi:DNA-binding beta-propeller fold protein YncE